MPPGARHGRQQHIDNAEHHRQLAALVETEHDRYRDWLVTAYFYVIVHLVEACLASRNVHSREHRQRLSTIGDHMGREWELEYERLLGRTRAYRYECETPTERELHDLLSRAVKPFMKYLCAKLHPTDSGAALLRTIQPF